MNKKLCIAALLVLIIAPAIVLLKMNGVFISPSFIERTDVKNNVEYENNDTQNISFKITSQYGVLSAIALPNADPEKHETLKCDIQLTSENGKVIYNDTVFAAKSAPEYYVFPFSRHIHTAKGEKLIVKLSQNPDGAGENIDKFKDKFVLDGKETGPLLYGGDISSVSVGVGIIWLILIAAAFIYGLILVISSKNDDNGRSIALFISIVIGIVYFAILLPSTVEKGFTDEWDNINGGILIAKGGVLYRDYITQHTPFAYYLCALFAKLGAVSLRQFRLMFYLTESAIVSCLCLRNYRKYGAIKLAAIFWGIGVLIPVVIRYYSVDIVSDRIQAMCTLGLLFEFFAYVQDRKIDLKRTLIVLCCVWCAIGSAFISVYSIFGIVLAVAVIEISDIIKGPKNPKALVKRYGVFFLLMLLPPLCAVIYFAANNSFDIAFDQFYLFNREVYVRYVNDGLGKSIFQPFWLPFFELWKLIMNYIYGIIIDWGYFVTAFIFLYAFFILAAMVLRKKFLKAFIFTYTILLSSIRGFDFHGMAAYFVLIMFCVVCSDEITPDILDNKLYLVFSAITSIAVAASNPCNVIFLIFVLSSVFCKKRISGKDMPVLSYAWAVVLCILSALFYTEISKNQLENGMYEKTLTDIEYEVIERTVDGEGIILDGYSCESLYFTYKNRRTLNRMRYILPWYVDRYGNLLIDDLLNNMPDTVVYKDDTEVWGYTDYNEDFEKELKKYYKKLSNKPDDYRNMIWVKKQN